MVHAASSLRSFLLVGRKLAWGDFVFCGVLDPYSFEPGDCGFGVGFLGRCPVCSLGLSACEPSPPEPLKAADKELAEALKINRSVTEISLSRNNIGDEGAQALTWGALLLTYLKAPCSHVVRT